MMRKTLISLAALVALLALVFSVSASNASLLDLTITLPAGGTELTIGAAESVNVGVSFVNNSAATTGNVILTCRSGAFNDSIYEMDSFTPSGPIVRSRFDTRFAPFVQLWGINEKPRTFAAGEAFNGTLSITGRPALSGNNSEIICELFEQVGHRLVLVDSARVNVTFHR
jgi:hypothetical protein